MHAILLALAAGVCWGVGEVFTKTVLHTGRVGPITAIAVRSAIALPILVLAYVLMVHVWAKEPRDWTGAGTGTLAKLMLGSGVLAGAAGMICFYAALQAGEISRVKPIAFTVAPATAVVIGMVLLGEPVTPRKIIAIVLILTGVVLLTGK